MLFRRAIEENEEQLVKQIEVEGTGLWTHLRSRKVLIAGQIEICQKQVFH